MQRRDNAGPGFGGSVIKKAILYNLKYISVAHNFWGKSELCPQTIAEVRFSTFNYKTG